LDLRPPHDTHSSSKSRLCVSFHPTDLLLLHHIANL
jgi:hypothetical protein